MTADADVLVGVVGRAHGLRGEVSVRPTTDFVETRFAAGAAVTAHGRTLRVTGHRWQAGSLVVTFDGIADRSAAEALRGTELWAAREGADVDTEAGEFHDHELIGLGVVSNGRPRGTVTGVRHLPGQDLLVIDTPAGERLVPFVEALVPVVDLAGGHVEVADLPGLLAEADEEA